MSATALATPPVQDFTSEQPYAELSDVRHDPHLHVTIGRMLDFCNQRPMTAPFTARGIVVDTTADIAGQLRDYFPSHLDLTPVIERMAEVCMERARATGQYLQVVSFDHLKQIKPIDTDEGNLESFIEVFADRRVKISSYTGIKTALKAGGGGSGGGDPHQMLAEIRQADIQGFALQIKSLDISDAKAGELLAQMGIAQAFGGDGPAIAGALETIAKGGPEGAALQAVVEQTAEIKTLRTALVNAPDAVAATPIAAAIAIKTEALSAQVQSIRASDPKVTAILKANVTQTIESVKTVLIARQIENVVTQLSTALPAGIARIANDIGRNTMSVQIARAVAAVATIARTNNLEVRDIVALVLTKNATPAMVKAVEGLTKIMAKPEFLPTLEKGVAPRVALSVREILTTPVLQSVASAPALITSVAKAVQALGEKSGVTTIMSAAAVLSVAGQKVASDAVVPTLRLPQLQAVIDNLQAVAMTSAMPGAMRSELSSVTAQVQALSVQIRSPEPSYFPTTPQALPAQAPLAVVAQAVNVSTPAQIAPAAPEIAAHKGAPNPWGESPNALSERPIQTPTAQQPNTQQASNTTPVVKGAETQPSPVAEQMKPQELKVQQTDLGPILVAPSLVASPVLQTPPVTPPVNSPVQFQPDVAPVIAGTIVHPVPVQPVLAPGQPELVQHVAPQQAASQVISSSAAPVLATGERVVILSPREDHRSAPPTASPFTEVKSAMFMDGKKADAGRNGADAVKKVESGCGTCKGEKGCCKAFAATAVEKQAIQAGVDQIDAMIARLSATHTPKAAGPR